MKPTPRETPDESILQPPPFAETEGTAALNAEFGDVDLSHSAPSKEGSNDAGYLKDVLKSHGDRQTAAAFLFLIRGKEGRFVAPSRAVLEQAETAVRSSFRGRISRLFSAPSAGGNPPKLLQSMVQDGLLRIVESNGNHFVEATPLLVRNMKAYEEEIAKQVKFDADMKAAGEARKYVEAARRARGEAPQPTSASQSSAPILSDSVKAGLAGGIMNSGGPGGYGTGYAIGVAVHKLSEPKGRQ